MSSLSSSLGTLSSSVGLISGINSQSIVNSLINLARAPVVRLENRAKSYASTQTGIQTLQARILSLTTSVQALGKQSNVAAIRGRNSDESQFAPTTTDDVQPGTHVLQTVRTATTQQVLSKGFANPDVQKVGTGQITISQSGQLARSTLLDELHGGNGIRRGTIRVTDRSGATADIDLSDAYTVRDVVDAINAADGISVRASTLDGHLVLDDLTGSTGTNLSVADVGTGRAATDLGIVGSVAADVLTGSDVFSVVADTPLSRISDGLGLRIVSGAPALRITLSDDTVLDVNLDDAASVGDVVNAVNDHEDNGGKVLAELVDGRLRLTDQSGGGGSSTFAVEDVNDADAVRQLGLDVAASGNTIDGTRLSAGIDSVLLKNLRGGRGIDDVGQIALTDRAGRTATVDLAGAESLDEVLAAINAAEDGLGAKLSLTARIDDAGTGIVVEDTSGSTASNLIVADVGPGTLATQLGIAVDAATTSVAGGALGLRSVGSATSVSKYAPDGTAVSTGSILIRDSAGNEAVVSISSAVKTIGDVLQRINSAAGIEVTAQLNDTGDGFVLIDDAGGAGTLTVESTSGDTASDLRLLGAVTVGGDGKQRIDSRWRTVVDVTADDTLETLAEKLNAVDAFAVAEVVDDGSAFNSYRLRLTAKSSGQAATFHVESTLDLGLTETAAGRDALLRTGSDPVTAFLVASGTNTFESIAPGLDVTVLKASDEPATLELFRDVAKVQETVDTFVSAFNGIVSDVALLTKFDPETGERGLLQGESFVLRMTQRLQALATRQFGTDGSSIRTLSDLGVRFGEGGKLEFDEAKLAKAIESDPEAVSEFFLDAEAGFAEAAQDVIDGLTDPLDGMLTRENSSLQTNIDSLVLRIEQLDSRLAVRRDVLLRQYANLETVLAGLSDQQSALSAIVNFGK